MRTHTLQCLLATILLLPLSGCKTFKTTRVIDPEKSYRGTPTIIKKLHLAIVTWEEAPAKEAGEPVLERREGNGAPAPAPPVPAQEASYYSTPQAAASEPKVHTTQHLCRLPTLYTVDVVKAPIGLTKAEMTYGSDFELTKSSAELDQKVPETLDALANLIPKIESAAKLTAGAPFNPYQFYPALPADARILSIEFCEIE